jgi:hypothetical protein
MARASIHKVVTVTQTRFAQQREQQQRESPFANTMMAAQGEDLHIATSE